MLDGKKTYVVAGLVVATAVVYGLGYIDKEHFEAIVAALMGLGLATLRQSMK